MDLDDAASRCRFLIRDRDTKEPSLRPLLLTWRTLASPALVHTLAIALRSIEESSTRWMVSAPLASEPPVGAG
jgi:hypothetical protein